MVLDATGAGGGGRCVCEIKYINQLHPARMGYGSCWVFPPLLSSPILSPNDISPHRSAGSCRQGGAPRPPSPKSFPEEKRNIKAKGQRERERENAPNRQESTAHVTSRPGDGPPPASPFQTVWRGPGEGRCGGSSCGMSGGDYGPQKQKQ